LPGFYSFLFFLNQLSLTERESTSIGVLEIGVTEGGYIDERVLSMDFWNLINGWHVVLGGYGFWKNNWVRVMLGPWRGDCHHFLRRSWIYLYYIVILWRIIFFIFLCFEISFRLYLVLRSNLKNLNFFSFKLIIYIFKLF